MSLIPYPSSPVLCHPAAEREDKKTLTLNGKRQTIHLCAYGWETRYSWGHTAYCPELGISVKFRYYNRTWEAHRFDSVISELLHRVKMTDKNFRAKQRRDAKVMAAYNKAVDDYRAALPADADKWAPLPYELQFGVWEKKNRRRVLRKKSRKATRKPRK